jgi:hypothetical protein
MRNVLRIAIPVALMAIPAVAVGSSSQVWAINCNREQFKPKKVVLACGDGASWLGGLKWTSWGASDAMGAGKYNAIDCTPSCASGHTKTYPVKVTLSRPKTCPGQTHLAFKQAALTYTGTRPMGAPAKLTFRCPSGLPGQY